MSTLLCVLANPKMPEESRSLTIAQEFLDVYRKSHPGAQIVTLDVYRDRIPLVDADVIRGRQKMRRRLPLTREEEEKVSAMDVFTDQFIAADKYVIVSPMWNLSTPSMLKAYIEAIVVPGKTFKFTPSGPVGLLHNKKAVHIHARGGVYSHPPMSEMDFADRYVRAILAFLGVTNIQSIICEGYVHALDWEDSILEAAIAQAREVAAGF